MIIAIGTIILLLGSKSFTKSKNTTAFLAILLIAYLIMLNG